MKFKASRQKTLHQRARDIVTYALKETPIIKEFNLSDEVFKKELQPTIDYIVSALLHIRTSQKTQIVYLSEVAPDNPYVRRKYKKRIYLPFVKKVELFGYPKLKEFKVNHLQGIDFLGHKILVNKKVIQNFKNVEQKLQSIGYKPQKVVGYNPWGRGWDSHKFGIAVDLDPNPSLKTPRFAQKRKSNISDEVINAFIECGFLWGGEDIWIYEPYHFEVNCEELKPEK